MFESNMCSEISTNGQKVNKCFCLVFMQSGRPDGIVGPLAAAGDVLVAALEGDLQAAEQDLGLGV